MSADPYSELVREYFADPRHCGQIEGGSAVDLDDQGVRLRLSATCEGGRIQSMQFRAFGCPHVIAACEAICRSQEGQSASSLTEFEAGEIMRTLSVPVEKTGRILVLEDAVRSLGRIICAGAATD